MVKIKKIVGREILDSRGNPTVEVDVVLDDGTIGRAAVPSGASTGTREALELRDNDKNRFLGKGVTNAIKNINDIIAPELIGKIPCHQKEIDELLIKLDGTQNKSKIGANAMLAVSLAICRAASEFQNLPLYIYIRQCFDLKYSDYILPTPLMNVLNGGVHADNDLDIQEFMIVPVSGGSFKEALRVGCEVFHNLRKKLKEKNHSTNVGDEGGFAPALNKTHQALDLLMEAIKQAGYSAGEDVFLALDSAASELYEEGVYKLKGENREYGSDEFVEFYKEIVRSYPVISIEDAFSEDDEDGWRKFTKELKDEIQIVGDDLFVTNPKILEDGIKKGLANAILIKLNQIGTLTETIKTFEIAKKAGYNTIISHRSGETEDTFIADLSVALNSGQIKTGSASRTDRIAKYNQLIRIEEELGKQAKFMGIGSIK
jgi:enolase